MTASFTHIKAVITLQVTTSRQFLGKSATSGNSFFCLHASIGLNISVVEADASVKTVRFVAGGAALHCASGAAVALAAGGFCNLIGRLRRLHF